MIRHQHTNPDSSDPPLPPFSPVAYRTLRNVALFCAAVLGAVGGDGVYRVLEARSWPEVPGTVRASQILVDTIFASIGKYSNHVERARVLHIEYEYVVGATTYRATRIRLRAREGGRARTDSLAYPVGAVVRVHYDPDNPKLAVVDTSLGWKSASAIVGALVLLAAAGLAARRINRAKPNRSDTADP